MFRMPSDLTEREQRTKVYGVVIGVVTDNKDPDGFYRVKCRFPWLPNGDTEQSDWCRVATMGAGGDRGWFCLPEIDDEVLVAFEHGDIARPYVVGTLWNGGSEKATRDNKDGKNNFRSFKSRSGHVLEFCDDKENKKEKISLTAKSGARIVVDDKDGGKKIEIYDDTGDNFVLIDAQNKKITMQSKNGDIELNAKGNIVLKAEGNIETTSKKDTKLKADGNYEMNTSGTMKHKSSSSGNIEAGSTLTVKGSQVNIN
jgi:uncharacterized protein involved in type VI secretion and phage assembly